MPATLKYLGVGLVIGSVAAALLGAASYFSLGMARPFALAWSPTPSPTDVPTITPTPSPTPTASLTATPLPSPTSTPVPPSATPDAVHRLIQDGGLAFAGPLSEEQQIAIYQSSLNYIANDTAGSRRIAKLINGVGYGDPSNICGPLSIAILRDAGLMNPEIVPHDFWLLDPLQVSGSQLLKAAFPREQYDYTKTDTPLNKMDWNAFPLVPGDFLFIWHGSWGNFDHMLVVTRLDSAKRAYAVTNYGTHDGFLIAEAMLYDPGDPSAGLFHTWTKERDAILGSTGFGGFELWRRRP